MAHCINVNSKELLSLSQELGINPKMLAPVIGSWLEIHNTDKFPSSNYLKKYFKLAGESKTQYSSEEAFNKATNIWDKLYKNPKLYYNQKQALADYNKAIKLFGRDNVSLITQPDKLMKLTVLKPVSNIIEDAFDADLNAKLVLLLQKLYPQIKLDYTNTPIIYEKKKGVKYQMSSILKSALRLVNNIYFNNIRGKDLSQYEIERINELLKRISDSIGDVPWLLMYSRNGNLYVGGYKRSPVTMDTYYSPNLRVHYQIDDTTTGKKRILGLADLLAMTVLIDSINQKQDTLPHEYAHHYIAWFRNTPIVQEAIKKYGSEEELVQAIGERVVAKKGGINTWWRRFSQYIKSLFRSVDQASIEELTDELTDAFLRAKKLGAIQLAQGIYNQTSFAATSLIEIKRQFYTNPKLGALDRSYLAKQAITQFSNILDAIQGINSEVNPIADKLKYFGNDFDDIDFTTMSRHDIINKISALRIFDVVRDRFFDPLEREDIEDEAILDKLSVAYENFSELLKSAYHLLIDSERLNILDTDVWVDEVTDADEEVTDTMTDGEAPREAWTRNFKTISVKESLSPLIKRALQKIRERDEEGNIIKDKFGFEKLLDTDTVYNTVLKGINKALTIELMETQLEATVGLNPWMQDILDLIQKEPFRSQFYLNFRKDFLTYSVVRREIDEDGNYFYKTIIVNTRDLEQSILEDVSYAIKDNSFALITNVDPITGKGKVNVTEVEKLLGYVNTLMNSIAPSNGQFVTKEDLNKFSKDNLRILQGIMQMMGIEINDIALNQYVTSGKEKAKKEDTKIYELLEKLDIILSNMNSHSDVTYDIFGKDGVKNAYQGVAKLLSSVINEDSEASIYEGKKLYYSYVTPSYLGKLVINLKNTQNDMDSFNEFMENNYLKYDWFVKHDAINGDTIYNSWLRELSANTQNGKTSRDLFAHKVQLHFNGTPYTELSAQEYTLSLMLEYFADFSSNPTFAWYHVPILADKPSAEFIRYKRITTNYEKVVNAELSNLAMQELRRIKTVLERVNNNVESINAFDIKLSKELKDKVARGEKLTYSDIMSLPAMDRGGFGFKFLDFLNAAFEGKDPRGANINTFIKEYLEGNRTHTKELLVSMEGAIKYYMNEKFKGAMLTWEKTGVLDTYTNPKTKKETFIHLNNLGSNREEVEGKLREYFYNSYLATSNIIQLTVTDIAYYENNEDFQKRFALIHSPALRFNTSAEDRNGVKYSKDGINRTMYLADQKVASSLSTYVTQIFDEKINNAKTSALKAGYKKLKEEILKGFGKVNVTDGQAFASIKSYRKKLGMAGKWDETMENAYEKILSGNWTLADLDVIWQPLKPFVYSLIEKNSFASTMSNLKVPVQNKNSEYLLLLTSAIIAGSKGNSRLAEIAKFMDENDIDTVQFGTAVKSGKQGVIDINNLDNSQINSVLSQHLLMENGEYNELYMHSIPFEDYGIQQEVPEHLMDATQLMGSLIRKLIMADITPGTIFNVNGENIDKDTLLQEYQELIAANVLASYDQLIEDLQLKNMDREARNKAISSLLKEEINKNGRYGPELLRAVDLDENNEFVVPLSDPIHSYRIQQLFNSIIKSRLTKLKIKGGAAVQVSPYGLENDLEIVFNEDGSIKYFECYIPIPSESWKDMLRDVDSNGKEYYNINKKNKNGEYILPDNLRKLIGYRIPTEDKYSMVPMKIKGFLPELAGSAVMLPKEITLLSGSDYDIDKLYLMIPEFKVTPYYEREEFIKDLIQTLGEPITDHNIANVRYVLDKGKDHQWPAGSTEDNIYRTWKANLKAYKNVEEGVIEKVSYDKSKTMAENTTAARNNRLIDIITSILTNKDTSSKILNPGSFDVQKKSARIITILKNSKKHTYTKLKDLSIDELQNIIDTEGILSGYSLLSPETQVYFHQLNTTAGKLIGIFANHNTSHALLQLQDINFRISDEDNIIFDGIGFNSITDTTNQGLKRSNATAKLDNILALDGYTLITKNIAGFLAASVDAVKDPVLNYMNLNTFTANAAMVLARLGYDSDSIGLLLTLPAIVSATLEYLKLSNEGYVNPKELLLDIASEQLNNLGGVDVETRMKHLSSTDFTKEKMAEMLSADPNSLENKEYQVDALLLFSRLVEMGENLNDITFISKFDTVSNAVGPTIADTLAKYARVAKFRDKQGKKTQPFGDNTYNIIENSPLIKAFYNLNKDATDTVFAEHFPLVSADVKAMFEAYLEEVEKAPSADIVNLLINDYLAFKLTSASTENVFNSSLEERSYYLNTFPKEFEAILTNPKYTDNSLIKALRLKLGDRRTSIMTITAKTGGLSTEGLELLKNGWSDLLMDPETRDIALKLFTYNFFRSGFNFSPNSFMHAATIEVKRAFPGYIESLISTSENSLFTDIGDGPKQAFFILFKRNHYSNLSITPNINKNILKVDTIGQDKIKFDYSMFKTAEFKKLILKDTKGKKTFTKIILLTETNDRGETIQNVWMHVPDGSNSPVYIKTTPLGIRNQAKEYMFGVNPLIESAIASNLKDMKTGGIVPGRNFTTFDDAYARVNTYREEIQDVYNFITGKTMDELEAAMGRKVSDYDSKIKLLLRAAIPGFMELEADKRTAMIKFFTNIELRDATGEIIC